MYFRKRLKAVRALTLDELYFPRDDPRFHVDDASDARERDDNDSAFFVSYVFFARFHDRNSVFATNANRRDLSWGYVTVFCCRTANS